MDKVEPLAESGSWELPIVEVLEFFFFSILITTTASNASFAFSFLER